jgi:hypothetical protein
MHPDDKTHGDIALIIKSDIKHYEISKYQREFLQATSSGQRPEWLYYYFSHILTA